MELFPRIDGDDGSFLRILTILRGPCHNPPRLVPEDSINALGRSKHQELRTLTLVGEGQVSLDLPVTGEACGIRFKNHGEGEAGDLSRLWWSLAFREEGERARQQICHRLDAPDGTTPHPLEGRYRPPLRLRLDAMVGGLPKAGQGRKEKNKGRYAEHTRHESVFTERARSLQTS
jgi:hypothetical protein